MRVAVLLLLLTGCSSNSSSDVDAPIDRSGFDLLVCGGGRSSFDGVTPATAPDYMELRVGGSVVAMRGERCSRASDRTACEQSVAGAEASGWPVGTGGGIPAPEGFIVAVRGDVVESVGARTLPAFLGALDAADAAFLAEIATHGVVDCTRPAARRVEGGLEVVTTTTQTCGGRRTEQRVFVSNEGAVTVRETRVLHRGVDEICP